MPKVQKTVMVQEDLFRLVSDIEKRTGASFARTIHAALLQYLFQYTEGPSTLWMEYVAELENDEITIGDIPRRRAREATDEYFGSILDTEIPPGGEPKEIPYESQELWDAWMELAEAAKVADPIKGIIDHRRALRKK